MSIDERGTLYLSGSGGVWVVDKFGESLGLIPIPEFCSNVAFGGPEGKTLYLTCEKQVYSLAMKVKGGQFTRKNK
jgi:gluconolactonase